MVEQQGFEPWTSALQRRRSSQLSYWPDGLIIRQTQGNVNSLEAAPRRERLPRRSFAVDYVQINLLEQPRSEFVQDTFILYHQMNIVKNFFPQNVDIFK